MTEPKDRLVEARRKRYGSPTEAAAALKSRGVNKNTLISHENGNRAISRKAAELYAGVFGVKPGWILFGDQCETEASPKSAAAAQILSLAAQLPEHELRDVLDGLTELLRPEGVKESVGGRSPKSAPKEKSDQHKRS